MLLAFPIRALADEPTGLETVEAVEAGAKLSTGSPLPCREAPVSAEGEKAVAISFVGIRADGYGEEAIRTIESLLIDALETQGKVQVRTRGDLGRLLDEQAARWLAGCTDEDCQQEAQEVLQSANTPLFLMADLSRAGGRATLQLSLFSNSDGRLVGRALVRASGSRKLQARIRAVTARVLSRASLLRDGFDITGYPQPRFHLTLKLGNALSRIASLDLNLFGYRMDLETNLYVRPDVLLFLVIGMALGTNGSGKNADAIRLQVIPASFGAKGLWTFGTLRAWAGAGIGPGVLGITRLDGQRRDFRSAFALTLVAGGDFRVHRRWTLAMEASTNLTDAIFGFGAGDAQVPVVFGLTLGASFLFF